MADTFVYREKELEKLYGAYRALDGGGFQVRFIVGEAGTGKSVILEQFIDRVLQTDGETLVTGCACTMAGEKGEEYQPFKDILQEIVKEIGSEQEAKRNRKEKWKQVFGASADVLLKVAPDLIENFVPMGTLLTSIGSKVLEETGVRQRLDKMKAGNGLLPDLLKLADQYVEVLKLIAGRYRLVIYMDNLQWADRASLELLQRLQAVFKKYPVLLLGCYRSTDVSYVSGEKRHLLETFVTHVTVGYGDVFVDLDRQTGEEKEVLTGKLLGTEKVECSPAFREEMFRRTGGNPLFVREYLRVLKENGGLVQGNEKLWSVGRSLDWEGCPVRIEGVVREKVAGLPPDKAEVLSCAAVQGQRFLLQVLVQMTGRDEMELLDWLTGELGAQRHLVYEGECFRLGERMMSPFYFSDDFLRGYLYRRLGASRRMLLHGRVTKILEELYEGRTEQVCFELAWHAERAGEKEKALYYLGHCLRKAEQEADYGRMAESAEGALKLLDKNDPVALFWRLKRISSMRKSGRYPVQQLELLWEEIPGPEEIPGECAGWCFWERWNMMMLNGDLRGAEKMAGRFSAESKAGKDWIYGRLAAGITAYWTGQFEQGRQVLRECGSALKKVKPEEGEYVGICALYAALTEFRCGDYEEAERIVRRFAGEVREMASRECLIFRVLMEMWLAFLDDDTEGLKEGVKRSRELKQEGDTGWYGIWLDVFTAAVKARKEVWQGLELLRKEYERLGSGYGTTLYGFISCRICFAKDLYEVFDGDWKKIVLLAQECGEKAYLGELYLLMKRRLETVGKSDQGLEWLKKAKDWLAETGGVINGI